MVILFGQKPTPNIEHRISNIEDVDLLKGISDTKIQMKIIKAEISENRNPSVIFRQGGVPHF